MLFPFFSRIRARRTFFSQARSGSTQRLGSSFLSFLFSFADRFHSHPLTTCRPSSRLYHARPSAHERVARRCSHLVRFFYLFPFPFRSLTSPFSHMFPSSLCHVSRRPPAFLCDSTPPPSPRSGTPTLPRLGLGCDATRHRLMARSGMRPTLDAASLFWFVSSFFFFSFFADRSPFLTSAQGPLSLQMRVGVPSFCDTTLPAPSCLIQGQSPLCGFPCKVHTYL